MKLLIKKDNVITYMGIICLLLYFVLSISTLLDIFDFLIKPMLLLATLLLIISMLKKTKKLKYLFVKIILLLIAFISYKLCDDITIFLSFLLIFSINQDVINSVLKIIYYFWIVVLLIHIFLYFTNYLFGVDVPVYYSLSGKIRYSLFLGHPNFSSEIIFWTTLIKIYLLEKKDNKTIMIISIISLIINYMITRSRTTLLFMIIFLVLNKIFIENKYLDKLCKYIFPVCASISLILAYLFQKLVFITSINKYVSGRFGMNYIVLNYFGITWLSKPIDYSIKFFWNNNYVSSLIIDNLYIRFFVNYGVILLGVMSILIYYFVKKKYKKVDNLSYLLLIILSLMAFSENHMLNAMIGFPLLFLCSVFEEGDII